MKEVIFHFFPSVRFLGLSLKILFHKNKEIERMLSKKMAFSLMSLITLFAFAFVVPSAMAAAFEIKIAGPTSAEYVVDDATGAIAETNPEIEVKLKVSSGQPIDNLTATEITISAFDGDGFVIDLAAEGENTEVTVFDLPIVALDTADSQGDNPGNVFYAMKTPKEHQLLVRITPVGDTTSRAIIDSTIAKVVISIKGEIGSTDPTLAAADSKSKADVVRHTITLTEPVDTRGVPSVVSVQRLRPGSQTAVAAFQEVRIKAEPFNVRIVLTAPPHGIDLADVNNFVEVQNGTVSNLVTGVTFTRIGVGADATAQALRGNTLRPHPIEGMYEHLDTGPLAGVPNTGDAADIEDEDTVPLANTVDDMYRQYRVTITPHKKSADFDVKVRVKSFHDNGAVLRRTYVPVGFDDGANGRDVLRVPVSGTARNLTAGYKVTIPKDWIIPANGYLVIAQDAAGSKIVTGPAADPGKWRTNDTPRGTHRTPAQLLYNVIGMSSLPNLATAFLTGVVVDVESQHPLVVSEVMWGEDTSLSPSSKSQYIELYNPGAQYKTIADLDETPDINEALTLIFYASNEFDAIPARGAAGSLPAGVTDRIGTLDADGDYWSPTSKGQSGRSGTIDTDAGELTAGRGAFVDAVPIVSMYRVIEEGVAILAADEIVVAFEAEYAHRRSSGSWMGIL